MTPYEDELFRAQLIAKALEKLLAQGMTFEAALDYLEAITYGKLDKCNKK